MVLGYIYMGGQCQRQHLGAAAVLLIGITWVTSYHLLSKLRTAIGQQDTLYQISQMIEFSTLIVGKRPGKRGREAEVKSTVMNAYENQEGKPGFVAMEVCESVSAQTLKDFVQRRHKPQQTAHTDAFLTLNCLWFHVKHIKQVTPPEQTKNSLVWVQIVIAGLKRVLLGTYQGTNRKYPQGYLVEFAYRFNQSFLEPQIPKRLLLLCVDHVPMPYCGKGQ